MRISFICCPFRTSFGGYGSCLKSAIESKNGSKVQWVASNCGCGDPMEASRQFQIKQCDYFEMPMPMDYRSTGALRRRVRGAARSAMVYLRARRYPGMLDRPDIVHFHQVLNSYGSKAVFAWLSSPTTTARVVTVHEFDSDQLESPETNATYNRADAIIVHCEDARDRLIRFGVRPEKIHVSLHGTTMPVPRPEIKREGIVFYAGHKVMSGKGIETLFKALAILQAQRPGNAPTLTIHGHYGSDTPPEAIEAAKNYGIADQTVWLNQISEDDVIPLYQRSALCVLPYTGSFAGLAAAVAAACELPVIGTRKAGLPDHLGDTGVWVDENNPEQLGARIGDLLDNESRRREIGVRLSKRAQNYLSWDVVADQTLQIYDAAVRNRVAKAA